MGIAISNMSSQPEVSVTASENHIKVHKGSIIKKTIKKWFRHLLGQWQGKCLDRKWLWYAADDSCMTHSVSKRVWRRHSALLVYARSHGAEYDPGITRRKLVSK